MKVVKALFVLALMFQGLECMAQPGSPSAPAPIDGGVIMLAAAGAAYGAKKRINRKTNQSPFSSQNEN